MASGWAIASAVALALSLSHVLLDVAINREAVGAGDRGEPGGLPSDGLKLFLVLAFDVAIYAGWAYAMVLTAHGDKSALLAVFLYVLVWGFGQGGATIVFCLPGLAECPWPAVTHSVHVANLVFGGLAAAAVWQEYHLRRGRAQPGRVIAVALPLIAGCLYQAIF